MNYSELIEAANSYADRNDVEINENFDVFIAMAESKINRLLKTRKQSTRAYTPSVRGQEYYRLPPDFAGMRDLQVNSALPYLDHDSAPYEMVSPEFLTERRNDPAAGRRYYCVLADQIQVFPVMDAGYSIEMVYYQKVPPLNSSSPTNWLLQDSPDIYLRGVLAELEAFVKNYEVSAGWEVKMKEAVAELSGVDDEERWSGPPMVMRTEI